MTTVGLSDGAGIATNDATHNGRRAGAADRHFNLQNPSDERRLTSKVAIHFSPGDTTYCGRGAW